MKKAFRIAVIVIAAVVCLSFASCRSDGSRLLGVSVDNTVARASYYEVSVSAGNGDEVVYKTPNSVFPSVLQISVPAGSTSVTVVSYATAADGKSVAIASGSTLLGNGDRAEVVLVSSGS